MREPDTVARPALPDDLAGMADLFRASVADRYARNGIGMPLLRRLMEEGRRDGATTFFPAPLRFAFDHGLRLVGYAQFLTSAPFGDPVRYIPSGPSLY